MVRGKSLLVLLTACACASVMSAQSQKREYTQEESRDSLPYASDKQDPRLPDTRNIETVVTFICNREKIMMVRIDNIQNIAKRTLEIPLPHERCPNN